MALVVTPAYAKNPPPPYKLGAGIDAHRGYVPQRICSSSAKRGSIALMKALIATWGGSSWGISRGCSTGGTSEHKEGRALDWHMDSRKASDRAKVDDAMRWITRNRGEVAYRLGIMYIIWNQRIWSIYHQERGWRSMSSRGSWTANHKDHVHISLSWDGAMAQTSWWTGQSVIVPLTGPCGTNGRPACKPTIRRDADLKWPYKVTDVGPFVPYSNDTRAPNPTIKGNTTVDQTLSVSTGTWRPGDVTFKYQWYRDSKLIVDASSSKYRLRPEDVGKRLKVVVKGTSPATGFTATRTSNQTAKIAAGRLTPVTPTITPVPPAETALASVPDKLTAAPQVGQALQAVPGSWKPSPVTLKYQWLRDAKPIAGATAAKYSVKAEDVGRTLSVSVLGSKPGYTSATKVSAATQKVTRPRLTKTPTPVISGLLKVGATLRAEPGTWEPAPVNLAYVWYRNGRIVNGATRPDYQLTKADLNARISLRVIGSKPGFTTVNKDTVPTAVIGAGLTSARPTITGSLGVGQVLTAKPGTWKPSGVTLSYRWLRNGAPIVGATKAQYRVTAADAGARLSVAVTGSRTGYPSITAVSPPTALLPGAKLTTVIPRITGEERVLKTLTVTPGTWGPAPVTLSYQWLRNGKPITGATGRSYVLKLEDGRARISVRVTGQRVGYGTASRTSATTTRVATLKQTRTPRPTISGILRVGGELTANLGPWTPANPHFHFRWIRNGKDIPNAEAKTYTLTKADLNARMSVRIAAITDGYTTIRLTSDQTAKVQQGLSGKSPTVTGTAKVGSVLTGHTGTWGPGRISFAFQWYRHIRDRWVKIPNATKITYRVQKADRGLGLKLRVRGYRSGYPKLYIRSKGTAAVK